MNTPEELYKERTKRFEDAVQLKVPDRVPVAPIWGYFYAKYAGISPQEAHYDYDKWSAAVKKTVVDFQPDLVTNPRQVLVVPGPLLDILDIKQIRLPGHGVPANHSMQFVEAEYMKAEEYDAFLGDPSDYLIRTYLPRLCGLFESFKKFPPISLIALGYGAVTLTASLARREMTVAVEALLRAGTEARKWRSKLDALNEELIAMGFPLASHAVAQAPFDVIGDFLRGTRGVMVDMYRNPDKLILACEKILPILLQSAVLGAKSSRNNTVFIPLHKGADGLMSLPQFKTFYWPTLRKLIVGLIAEGLTPWLLIEADYTSRLEIISDIPRAKAIYRFVRTDIFKAKEMLGDRVCIRGNVPASLLCTGTPQEVKDYCKKLIDVVGKGGGFIMDAGTEVPDEARIENVKAMADFTREYGVYR